MSKDLYWIDDDNIFIVDDKTHKVKPLNIGKETNISALKPEIVDKIFSMMIDRHKKGKN